MREFILIAIVMTFACACGGGLTTVRSCRAKRETAVVEATDNLRTSCFAAMGSIAGACDTKLKNCKAKK